MYQYEWENESGGFVLNPDKGGVVKSIRPVFFEELDLLGLSKHWTYPRCKEPILWAEGARRYLLNGELVAETSGGGYYTEPSITIYKEGLHLQPIDVPRMVERNSTILEGMAQRAIGFVYDTWRKYRTQCDITYVAFSGGKDSAVLLDLVQRALGKDDFVVVFGDTQMELSDTYQTIDKTIAENPSLHFYTARSEVKPIDMWADFGPPSRRHRWCCGVHKSAPSLALLRELTKKDKLRALAFDGVRSDESALRATYAPVTVEGKHSTQINASPILDWNSAEVFLYTFTRRLIINPSYRKGMTRVGCAVCPMASGWFEYLTTKLYPEQITPYLDCVCTYAKNLGIANNKISGYIDGGNWKARSGGMGVDPSGTRATFENRDNSLHMAIRSTNSPMFFSWLPALGGIDVINDSLVHLTRLVDNKRFSLSIDKNKELIKILVSPFSNNTPDLLYGKHLKSLAYKTAYCIKCGACEAECLVGALSIKRDGVFIDEKRCIHCLQCFSFTNGCLRAKSLYTTRGGSSMYKGLNRYQHFGYREVWLHDYLEQGETLYQTTLWGKYQYESMKVWFKESLIVGDKQLLPLGGFMQRSGSDNALGWACIWTNLTYNSSLIRWYVETIGFGSMLTKNDLVARLGPDYSLDTNKNAIASLIETLDQSPLGCTLGLGECTKNGRVLQSLYKRGWMDVDPLAILYSLYRFAENEDGRYKFTLQQLDEGQCEGEGITPQQLFGIGSDALKANIIGLASQYPVFIRAEFAMGLDNIFLTETRCADDVLSLY